MKNQIKHPKTGQLLTKHHLIPRIEGGKTCPSNLLRLWENKHIAWHQVFGTMQISLIIFNFDVFHYYHKRPQWFLIFGNKDPKDCKELLKRMSRIKRSLKRKR